VEKMVKIYFAKFNFNEIINEVSKGNEKIEDLLVEVFNGINQTDKVQDEKDNLIKYKFVNLDFLPDKMIINGDIVKIYDGIDSNYDEENDEVIDKFSENKADYITFSFDVKKEIIGFVPKQTFSKNAFQKYFSLLVEQCVPRVGRTEIILIKSKDKIEKEFKKMKILKEVNFYLIPENNDDKSFQDLLEGIVPDVKETNAQHLDISLKGTLRKPLSKDSKLVRRMKNLAVMAYGKLKATGKDYAGDDFSIDSEKELLMTKDIRNDNRYSRSEIAELTQIGAENYRNQKAQEVIEFEGREGK